MIMGKWDWTRLAGYAVLGVGSLLSITGLADFDAATGVLDLRPINAYALVGATSGVGAAGLAMTALLRGWGRR